MAIDRYEGLVDEDLATLEEFELFEQTMLERLTEQFGKKILSTSTRLGEATAVVDAKAILDVMTWLRDEAGFVFLASLTVYDNLDPKVRFFVVYHLLNIETPERLRIKVGLSERKPEVASVVPIWPGANYLEREAYDLFGVRFKGHPNLKRIMMPEEWEGHPLRKDYPEVYEEVQFTHNMDEIRARKPFATR